MEKLDIPDLGVTIYGVGGNSYKEFNAIDAARALAEKLNEVIDFINSQTNEKKEEVL